MMDIVMIPGLWLDGSSWSAVTPPLEKAGHRVRALTLPGKESKDADRAGITYQDHVDAVVAVIDRIDDPVVLVGHSGGGSIVHSAADARPERVARIVYVDSAPFPAGSVINDDIPEVDGELPLPESGFFEPEDVVDREEEQLREFRERAIPEPTGVAYDPKTLGDERRFDVPATLICCEFTSAQVKEWIARALPFTAELVATRQVDYIDLPTGHWPQFSKPTELGEAIGEAVRR